MIHIYLKRFFNRIQQTIKTLVGKVIFLIITCIIIGTIGFYFLEFPRYTPMESFYWTVITITTIGFGDVAPITIGGQILAVFLAFVGVMVLTLTFAIILEVALESRFFQIRKFARMVKKMEEITLICGYNEKIRILIEELSTEGIKIVLVNNQPIPEDWDAKWGAYIQGDPTEDQTLLNAGIKKAKKALISLDDDGDTLLVILSIQSLNKNCYTIAEIKSQNNLQHFKRVNCNQIISQEEILGKFFNITLLLPMLFPAYNELISMEGNEIYMLEQITEYLGKSFEETIPLIKHKHDALLIGLVRQNQTVLNPSFDTELQANDILLVISETFVE